MATIVTRSGKGSPLTNTEVDANFTNLNSDKLETSAAYTHPNHTGEVTSSADGATTIADNVVDEANLKVSNSPTNGYLLTAQSGNTGGLTWAENAAMPLSGGTFSGDVTFADNEYAKFGTDEDVHIGHNGNGIISNYTSDLYIQNYADDKDVIITSDDGSGGTPLVYFRADGSTGETKLYYYGSEKIKTTTSGVDVSGYADVDNGMRHNGNLTNEILFGSNTQTFKTNGSDRIHITNTGVSIYPSLYANGDIVLTDTNSQISRPSSGNIAFTAGGAERARINSDGVTVKTGRLAVQDTSTAGTVRFHEAAAGANYVDVVAPSSLGADYTVTLPAETGTAMLWQSGWSDDPTTGAGYNIAIGEDAFNSATAGSSNIAIGKNAMYAYTTGQYSVAIGTNALASNQTDSHNVAVGYETGRGDYLLAGTYVGSSAGNYNSSHKDYQTAIGYHAMNDCSADYSTSVGAYSMTDGNHYRSVAVGWYALGRSSTSSPYYNTAVGSYAGLELYSGDGNTLVGYGADPSYYATSYGVAVGYQPKAGTYGVSIGYHAGTSQTTTDSNNNICIGMEAGYDLDGGDYCVFIGDKAGYAGGTGDANTSVGMQGLFSLTSGTQNNSLGYWSLKSVTSGDNNSSIGSNSGRSVSTGSNNTLLGYHAGYKQGISTTNALTTGSNVTCVGFEAMPSSGTATNEIVLGDASISSLRCNVQTISSLSDERDKTAIKDLTYGLDFVNDMRPVEFTWNRRDGSLGAKTDMGFIAQELWETELDHSSSSRTRLVNWENPQKLEADYVRSYPILVKAVQELSAQVKALEARIEILEGN